MNVDPSTLRFVAQGSTPGVHMLYFASGLILEYTAATGEIVSARRLPPDVARELAETAQRDRDVAERRERLENQVL
jgi:hypothetical protein